MENIQPNVLVVDDIESNREILRRRLSRSGFKIDTASDGYKALTMLAEKEYDIVLLDIMMPGLSGIDVLKVIRGDTKWKNLPIIMVTAKDEGDILPECLDMGADDYVSKPINISVLKARMGAQLSKKWALDALIKAQEGLELKVAERTLALQKALENLEHEVGERGQAEKVAMLAKTRLEDAIEALSDGFALFDADLKLQISNTMFHKLYELPTDDNLSGVTYADILHRIVKKGLIPEAVGMEEDWVQKQLGIVRNETKFVSENERWMRVSQQKTAEGGLVGIYSDVTDYKQLQEELQIAIQYDHLTGIYNRHYFMNIIDNEMSRWHRYEMPLSLLFIDIDHFKQVNDTYGHAIGDKVLKQIGTLLGKVLRDFDTLARWGGEEFIILLPNTGGNDALSLAERLRDRVAENEIIFNSKIYQMTVSVGMADMIDTFEKAEDFIAAADQAMYRAKESGRNKVCV